MAEKTIYIVRKFDAGLQEAVIFAHCETLTTAKRISALHLGSDVVPWEAIIHNGFWVAPYREVMASEQDKAFDLKEAQYAAAKAKALALGLTEEELHIIEVHDNGAQ